MVIQCYRSCHQVLHATSSSIDQLLVSYSTVLGIHCSASAKYVIAFMCLAVDSTRTVVGLFRSLVRRSGTHCQMNSEIRRVMLTASNSSLKQSCSAFTSATSALEVNFNVMRSINFRSTYILTYLLTNIIFFSVLLYGGQIPSHSLPTGRLVLSPFPLQYANHPAQLSLLSLRVC